MSTENNVNYKGLAQQQLKLLKLPDPCYKTEPNDDCFKSVLTVLDDTFTGYGMSKIAAEQQAAEEFLSIFNKFKIDFTPNRKLIQAIIIAPKISFTLVLDNSISLSYTDRIELDALKNINGFTIITDIHDSLETVAVLCKACSTSQFVFYGTRANNRDKIVQTVYGQYNKDIIICDSLSEIIKLIHT